MDKMKFNELLDIANAEINDDHSFYLIAALRACNNGDLQEAANLVVLEIARARLLNTPPNRIGHTEYISVEITGTIASCKYGDKDHTVDISVDISDVADFYMP